LVISNRILQTVSTSEVSKLSYSVALEKHVNGSTAPFLKKFSCSKNSVALVRERTIPTERPPPVGKVSAQFSCGYQGKPRNPSVNGATQTRRKKTDNYLYHTLSEEQF